MDAFSPEQKLHQLVDDVLGSPIVKSETETAEDKEQAAIPGQVRAVVADAPRPSAQETRQFLTDCLRLIELEKQPFAGVRAEATALAATFPDEMRTQVDVQKAAQAQQLSELEAKVKNGKKRRRKNMDAVMTKKKKKKSGKDTTESRKHKTESRKHKTDKCGKNGKDAKQAKDMDTDTDTDAKNGKTYKESTRGMQDGKARKTNKRDKVKAKHKARSVSGDDARKKRKRAKSESSDDESSDSDADKGKDTDKRRSRSSSTFSSKHRSKKRLVSSDDDSDAERKRTNRDKSKDNSDTDTDTDTRSKKKKKTRGDGDRESTVHQTKQHADDATKDRRKQPKKRQLSKMTRALCLSVEQLLPSVV